MLLPVTLKKPTYSERTHMPVHTQTHTNTRTSRCLVAARRRVRRRLAEGSAEVLVHHRADVTLEVGEEDAAGAQVLGARRQLLVLLFDHWGAEPAAAVLVVLHFRIQGQLLKRAQIYLYECNKTVCSKSLLSAPHAFGLFFNNRTFDLKNIFL